MYLPVEGKAFSSSMVSGRGKDMVKVGEGREGTGEKQAPSKKGAM